MTGIGIPLIRSRPVTGGGAGFSAVRPTRNNNPCVGLPLIGNGPRWATPIAPAWSAWQQLTAGEASDYILDKLDLNIYAVMGLDIWIQLGIGVPPETVIAEFGHCVAGAFASGDFCVYPTQFEIDGYHLAVGTRLVVRSQHSAAVLNASRVGAIVVAMPDPPLFSASWDEGTYRQGGILSITRYPVVPNFINVISGAAANTWGPWVPFIPVAPNHLLLYRLDDSPFALITNSRRFQIGIGAGGVEVEHELTATPRAASVGTYAMGSWALSRPVEVLAGERVSVRHNNPTGATVVQVAVYAYDLNF